MLSFDIHTADSFQFEPADLGLAGYTPLPYGPDCGPGVPGWPPLPLPVPCGTCPGMGPLIDPHSDGPVILPFDVAPF